MPNPPPELLIARALVVHKEQWLKANTGRTYTIGCAAECIKEQLVALGLTEPKCKRVKGRNLHFDAMTAAFNYGDTVTKSAASQIAAAIKEIMEVEPAVTPEELGRVASAVRKKYLDSGPRAVSCHWHEFSHLNKRTVSAIKAAPAGWLAKLNELYPDSIYSKGCPMEITKETDYAWNQLDKGIRQTITDAL